MRNSGIDRGGVIYCTTNIVNGKKYIGQDSKNDLSYLGSGYLLHLALKKYGRENFIRENLQDCIDRADLEESEKYWIDYFNASSSDLFYNLSPGGTGGDLGAVAKQKLSLSNKKRYQRGESFGFQKGVGSKPYAHLISIAHLGKPKLHKRTGVIKCDLNGNSIKEYQGLCEVQLDHPGFYVGCISRVCLGQLKSYKGFIWKYL